MRRLHFPMHSLRAKLVLFSLLLALIPGVVLAVIAFASARQALETAVGQQLAGIADDTVNDAVNALTAESTKVHIWARQEFMRDVRAGDRHKRISRFLASLKDGRGKYIELLCVDADGAVVAATGPAMLGTQVADQPWFRSVSAGEDVLNGPTLSRAHRRSVIEIASPIHEPEGPHEVIGALLALYDWEYAVGQTEALQHKLADLGIPVDLLILDAAGIVLVAPRQGPLRELTGRNLRAAGWLAARPQPAKERRRYVREPEAAALIGVAATNRAPLQWWGLAVQPLRVALAPAYRMQQRLAVSLAGILLAGLVIALVLAQRMSRPLRELTRATRGITRADSNWRVVPIRSQDEIGELAGAFNEMVGELTRAQNRLLIAAKFAFVGELAASIAHEVRTPLSILRSSAQLLARSLPGDDARRREFIDTIVDEVDRLDRVVAGLLQLARPHEPLIEPTPLAPVLGRALDFVAAQAREKSIALHRRLNLDQRPAHCDPEQIYQVALNLIVNALQVLPPGGEITVRTLPPENGRVTFEVSDNGPGIPPEAQAHIFSPFFTLRQDGTGLGLALVQRVVEAHKGTVSVDSTIGQGTTFRVELPAAEVTA